MTRSPSLSTRFRPEDVVGYDTWTNLHLLTDGRLMPAELVGLSNKARRARIKRARLAAGRWRPWTGKNVPQDVVEHLTNRLLEIYSPVDSIEAAAFKQSAATDWKDPR